jgi:hypothetical protein
MLPERQWGIGSPDVFACTHILEGSHSPWRRCQRSEAGGPKSRLAQAAWRRWSQGCSARRRRDSREREHLYSLASRAGSAGDVFASLTRAESAAASMTTTRMRGCCASCATPVNWLVARAGRAGNSVPWQVVSMAPACTDGATHDDVAVRLSTRAKPLEERASSFIGRHFGLQRKVFTRWPRRLPSGGSGMAMRNPIPTKENATVVATSRGTFQRSACCCLTTLVMGPRR